MNWSANPVALLKELYGLEGRVALITGGASGIGAETVELFVAMGMKTYILDFNEDGGLAHAKEVNGVGYLGECKFLKLDVTSTEHCQNVVDLIAKENDGRIDILFNCAGISKRDSDLPRQTDRERLRAVNVTGTKNMIQAVTAYMATNSFGRIINMGSVVGFESVEFPLGEHYKNSKMEIHDFTKDMALDLAESGITINALAPGRVSTPLVTMPGQGWVAKSPDPVEAFRVGCATQSSGVMLKPEEVAYSALMLCSHLSKNMTGAIIDMSSGWAIGHEPYPAGKMPAAFEEFREWAQTTTETKITPGSTAPDS